MSDLSIDLKRKYIDEGVPPRENSFLIKSTNNFELPFQYLFLKNCPIANECLPHFRKQEPLLLATGSYCLPLLYS